MRSNIMPNYRGRIVHAAKPSFGPWWRVRLDSGGTIYARDTMLQSLKDRWQRGHDPNEVLTFACNDRWHQVQWCGNVSQDRTVADPWIIEQDGTLTTRGAANEQKDPAREPTDADAHAQHGAKLDGFATCCTATAATRSPT
jgi:hypothetical protein